MRCLALAQAWQDRGGSATLLTAALPAPLETRVRAEQLDVVSVEGDANDPSEAIRVARDGGMQWVVVDGYDFDSAYQRRIKDAGLPLLWIDDEAHAAPYSADVVLNQNPHAAESMYADRAAGTRLLLGPRYVLLRREFRRWRDGRAKATGATPRVLVTMGGGDAENVTLKAVEALRRLTNAEIEAVVVAGNMNPHVTKLEAVLEGAEGMRLERNVTQMPELMSWADVAIAAGGSTSWELAYFGVPMLLLPIAENQRPVAERLHEEQVAIHLGWHADVRSTDIADALSRLLADHALREDMSRRGREMIDGDGVVRIIESMEATRS